MKKIKWVETYNRIRQACLTVQSNGGKIVSDSFGNNQGIDRWCRCPISAVCYPTPNLFNTPIFPRASELLGVDDDWLIAFTEGFDGCELIDTSSEQRQDAFCMGQALRAEFCD